MNRQEGEEVVNCLYEGIELSDVEASLSPSVLSSSDTTALEANDGKTKRYRRNCFVLSTTILFAFLIFTFAVFLDMFMNEPKISAGELGLYVFFPTNEDDIDMTNKDISTKIRSDYVIIKALRDTCLQMLNATYSTMEISILSVDSICNKAMWGVN